MIKRNIIICNAFVLKIGLSKFELAVCPNVEFLFDII